MSKQDTAEFFFRFTKVLLTSVLKANTIQSLINVRFSANTVIKISIDKIFSGLVIDDLKGLCHSSPVHFV